MKLNKQEQKAIDDMRLILDAIADPDAKHVVSLTSGDLTNIERVLGINLWLSTLSKKRVKRAVRGKERCAMNVGFQLGGQHPAVRHCFFPFQVREQL
jgi:hypothetical protein